MAPRPSSQVRTEAHPANRILSPAAFALLLVFGLTAYGGANILRFEALANRIWFGPADQTMKNALDSVSAWKNTSSVGIAARSLMLDIIMSEASHDLATIEVALNELAAGSPTSTATWEALAEVRNARGESMDSALAAFRMSALTGSHEGYFMMQRAIFGLRHWNELPEEDRRMVVRDILLSIGPANHEPVDRYHEVLATKPEAERDNIRSELLASGLASSDVLQALGV
jgi:hypothetical protein